MKDLISYKQKIFCLEYLLDFNGTQAAIRAGYSEKSARQQAADLLTKPNILNFIEEQKKKYVMKLNSTAEAILAELEKIAFAISSDKKVKNSDKLKALELMGKYRGMFSEKANEQKDMKIEVQVLLVNKITNNNDQGEVKRLE